MSAPEEDAPGEVRSVGGPWRVMPALREYSLYLGRARVAANEARYRGTDKERLGFRNSAVYGMVRDDLWTEAIGILAELHARHRADMNAVIPMYTASTFLKKHPTDDCDLELCGRRYNIKATEGTLLMANKRATDKSEADCLVFFRFYEAGGVSLYTTHTYPPGEVQQWETKSIEGRSPYYQKEI